MVISDDDVDSILSLKQHLQQQFQMKDLGHLRYFLGLEVAYAQRGYLVSQQKYTSDTRTLGLLLLLLSYITGFLLLMVSSFQSLRGTDSLWVPLST